MHSIWGLHREARARLGRRTPWGPRAPRGSSRPILKVCRCMRCTLKTGTGACANNFSPASRHKSTRSSPILKVCRCMRCKKKLAEARVPTTFRQRVTCGLASGSEEVGPPISCRNYRRSASTAQRTRGALAKRTHSNQQAVSSKRGTSNRELVIAGS